MVNLSSELRKRIISGVLLAAIALICTLYSAMSFYALVLIGALLMYSEWLELTKPFPMLNKIGGLIYVGVPVWSLIALRSLTIDIENVDELGTVVQSATPTASYVIYLFCVVSATDIGAYAIGKPYGSRKLAPSLSPNKTIEGLLGGIACAAIVGGIGAWFVPYPHGLFTGVFIGACLAIVSQTGDLFESWLKRQSGQKDSGHLIPGHGGILDRVDGIVFAAPVYTLLVLLAQ